jgi:predicted enzyme related to lactoylglutathione lyase
MRSVATVFVKYLNSTSDFYEACFGLVTVADEPGDFRILESDALVLSVVQVPPEIAQTIVIATPPRRRFETPIKLGFVVLDIDETSKLIVGHGGLVDDTVWTFRGFQHRDFLDPEGNVGELRATTQLNI